MSDDHLNYYAEGRTTSKVFTIETDAGIVRIVTPLVDVQTMQPVVMVEIEANSPYRKLTRTGGQWGHRVNEKLSGLEIVLTRQDPLPEKEAASDFEGEADRMLDDAVAAYEATPGLKPGMTAALTACNLWADGAYLDIALRAYRDGNIGARKSMYEALVAVLKAEHEKQGPQ